jgi:molybdenum cofactor cytidylyltransferase
MGRPKAGLPITDRGDTFLSRIVRTLGAAGVPGIVVVTGAAPDAVRAAAGKVRSNVRFVHNERWAAGQLSSLLAGLEPRQGEDVEAALVALVDAPLASVETVAQVLRVWRHTRAPIVRPANGDVHGHPVVFDRALFDELRAADPHAGAKAVVRTRERDIVNVPVTDRGAFIDIDTDEDYRALVSELRTKN